jgi:hypothetical protein
VPHDPLLIEFLLSAPRFVHDALVQRFLAATAADATRFADTLGRATGRSARS